MKLVAALAAFALCACSNYYGLDPPRLNDAAGDGISDVLVDAESGFPDASTMALCPASYMHTAGDSRYRFVGTLVTWTEAASKCVADGGSGGRHTHLVVLANDTERAFVHTIDTSAFWVGLSDRLSEGQYQWNTDEVTNGYPALTSAAWGTGEPTGGLGNTDCIATLGNTAAELQDSMCTALGPYLCECDTYADDPSRYTP